MENVTVIIPVYNEEEFIGKVIKKVKENKNVNEIIVVDNNCSDNTATIAKNNGAIVVECCNQGKGYAMKKGMLEAKNNIIAFIDGDITNYNNNLIEKITAPLILKTADFVKADFERDGGRVTELLAKPLLELLFPNMQKFNQPLSGIMAGKKEDLIKLEFEKDYGVDIGILIDLCNTDIIIKEVNIGKVTNHSQNWKALGQMAKQVARAIIVRSKK